MICGGNCEMSGGFEFYSLAEQLRSELAKQSPRVTADGGEEISNARFALNCAMAALNSVLFRSTQMSRLRINDDDQKRAVIIASCIQGITPIEDCIFRGFFVQAAALVRQELEAIETLRSIRVGRYRDGWKGNSKLHALKHLGKVYGQLTDLAHLQNSKFLSHLVKDSAGYASIDPIQNEKFRLFLIQIHSYAIVGIVLDLADLTTAIDGQSLSDPEREHLTLCNSVLVEQGFLVPAESDSR